MHLHHSITRLFPLRILVFILALMFFLPLVPAWAQKKKYKKQEKLPEPQGIVIAENGFSRYRIVVPAFATSFEQKAATVLQDYLLQISGAALPIIPSDKSRSPYEILLGQNDRLNDLNTGISLNALEADGFIIRTDSMRLIIAGGNNKGTLYGVYTFLEKYLGCRMYTPQVKVIPKQPVITLGKVDDMEVPKIKYRDTHYKVTWDQEYSDWHKLNHDSHGERTTWGMWVHTFNQLVPPEIYFKIHPEYYALINGQRMPTQLCLTNPEVLKVLIQNLRKEIAKNPEAKYWSVSQNDNRQYCTCDQCMAINAREGSPSGSIIEFVNKVADQFPDKVISTLAYEYSRKAPKNLKPRKNVNIMLCSIEVFRDRPIAEARDSVSASFVKDVSDWGKIASDIIVWDYVIQFQNLLGPFPNLQVLQPNIQFFTQHGVTAMFEQGNREVGGEFAELRAYLISELLWDPTLNVDSLMDDFLNGYYGPAGKPIRQYIDLMRQSLLSSGQPLRIFGSPNEEATSFLTTALISQYNQFFDLAEAAVATFPDTLERVKIARLPVEFTMMEQAKKNYFGDNGLFIKQDGQWVPRSNIRAMIDPFTDLCIRQGVTRVKEWSTSPEAYRASMYRLFTLGMKEGLTFGRTPIFISPDSTSISPEERGMLTDGRRGGHDTDYSWMGCSGKDLDVVIDLGSVKQVKHMESAYYQLAAWYCMLPKEVEYFVSTDGKNYERVGDIVNDLPIDQYDAYQRDFISDFAPRDARYVRVKAHTIGIIPAHLPNGGGPATLLVDEFIAE